MNCLRAGEKRYLYSWSTALTVASFLTAFVSLMVFLGVTDILAAVFGRPFAAPEADRGQTASYSPLLLILLKSVCFSLGAVCWSLAEGWLILRRGDRFLALILPLAVYAMLDYLSAAYLHMPVKRVILPFFGEGFVTRFRHSVMILGGMAVLLSLAMTSEMGRRYRHETVS